MEENKLYECECCGQACPVAEDKEVPECCGKPMKPVDKEGCTSAPASAEHARPMEDEEPCDDFRSG